MGAENVPELMTPKAFRGGAVRKYTLKGGARPGREIDLDGVLNDQQREVVLSPGGPTLVIAGAGSGKTHTLTYRVAHLVDQGARPDRLLLLTFTNKAARAMTDRVAGLLGDKARSIWAGTFHSIANRVLRQDAHLLGYPTEYTILDAEDARTLMRACAAEAAPAAGRKPPAPKVLYAMHSMCANTQRPLIDVLEDSFPYFARQAETIRAVLGRYAERKVRMGLMDFDDLLLNWKRLLVGHPERAKAWAERFDHILVDEYQDTNQLQGEVVDRLAGERGNVMVVGDDCQSIYAFRGANYANILEFPKRYPHCRTYRLEHNYRSVPQILDLANASIAMNPNQFHKTLRPTRPDGPKPALVGVRDVYQQADFVCQRIMDLASEGVPLSEIAVMYRSHFHSMELQVEMTRREIPYIVRSGLRFFEQAHIKDVLSYLRFLYNPRDELSFMRLAQHWPGIGAKRAASLWGQVRAAPDPVAAAVSDEVAASLPSRSAPGWRAGQAILRRLQKARRGASPGELVEAILDGGYDEIVRRAFDNPENRLGDLSQLASYAGTYDDLEKFLGEIALLTAVSGQDILVGEEQQESVCLTSIHQAKGLEWDACFVLWLADGYFPSAQSFAEEESLEEERRLFYVASTRAKDDLYLVHPFVNETRTRGTVFLRPSPFVTELEQEGTPPELELWERWAIEEAPA